MAGLLRHPLAWLPMVLSLAAFGLLVAFAASCGTDGACGMGQGGDEGTAARAFQLLLAGQAVLVAVFAIRWLPERPQAAAGILALQIVIAAVPVVAILVLEG